jgi:hypothetical protein
VDVVRRFYQAPDCLAAADPSTGAADSQLVFATDESGSFRS